MDKEYLLSRVNNLLLTEAEKNNNLKNMSEENEAKILALKNIHKAKRCFIIGGAPSLKLLDLTKLNDELTFSVNKGYKLSELGLQKTTYHLIIDKNLLKDEGVIDEMPSDFSKLFFITSEADFYRKDCSVVYVKTLNSNNQIFQEDLTQPLMSSGTVVAQALQVAYYMGFSEIYLVGVDIDFSNNPGHFYQNSSAEQGRQLNRSIPSMEVMKKGLGIIVEFLKEHGVNVYNASPVGELSCMPRVSFEELFREKVDEK